MSDNDNNDDDTELAFQVQLAEVQDFTLSTFNENLYSSYLTAIQSLDDNEFKLHLNRFRLSLRNQTVNKTLDHAQVDNIQEQDYGEQNQCLSSKSAILFDHVNIQAKSDETSHTLSIQTKNTIQTSDISAQTRKPLDILNVPLSECGNDHTCGNSPLNLSSKGNHIPQLTGFKLSSPTILLNHQVFEGTSQKRNDQQLLSNQKWQACLPSFDVDNESDCETDHTFQFFPLQISDKATQIDLPSTQQHNTSTVLSYNFGKHDVCNNFQLFPSLELNDTEKNTVVEMEHTPAKVNMKTNIEPSNDALPLEGPTSSDNSIKDGKENQSEKAKVKTIYKIKSIEKLSSLNLIKTALYNFNKVEHKVDNFKSISSTHPEFIKVEDLSNDLADHSTKLFEIEYDNGNNRGKEYSDSFQGIEKEIQTFNKTMQASHSSDDDELVSVRNSSKNSKLRKKILHSSSDSESERFMELSTKQQEQIDETEFMKNGSMKLPNHMNEIIKSKQFVKHCNASKNKKQIGKRKSKRKIAYSSSDSEKSNSLNTELAEKKTQKSVRSTPMRAISCRVRSCRGQHGNTEDESTDSDLQSKASKFTAVESKRSNTIKNGRKSTRLKEKVINRNSFSVPSTKAYLKEITPDKYKTRFQNKRSYNNFLREQNTYNTEGAAELIGEYYSSEDENFIDDTYENEKRKKVGFKQNAPCSSFESSESEVETIVCKTKQYSKHISSCSDEEDFIRKPRYKRARRENLAIENFKKAREGTKKTLEERKKLRKEIHYSSSSYDSNTSTSLDFHDSDINFIDDSDEKSTSENSDVEVIEETLLNPTLNKPQKTFNRIQDNDLDSGEEDLLNAEEQSFFKMILEDNVEGVKKMTEKSRYLLNTQNIYKQMPIHVAAMNGFSSIVDCFINTGCDCNILDGHSLTPLAHSIINKHYECFKLLFECSDNKTISQYLHKHFNGKNLLHILLVPVTKKPSEGLQIQKCLTHLIEKDMKHFLKLLTQADDRQHLPYMTAIYYDHCNVLQLILSLYEIEYFKDLTTSGESIVHFAVHHSIKCFKLIVQFCCESSDAEINSLISDVDKNGFTPLMYACEMGKEEFIEVLAEAQVVINFKGPDGVTPLHLAAASGNLPSVNLLLRYKHNVDTLDGFGWPPILYAQFNGHESCVLKLMEANPKQIFCLGNLITSDNESQNKKNAKVIESTLSSLSYTDAYYSLFNQFIGKNLMLLDNFDDGLFAATWGRILSFANKVSWMRKKCANREWHASYLNVDRTDILASTMGQHIVFPSIDRLQVRFDKEEGSCLGPKREYFSCIFQEIVSKKSRLFTSGDNEQYCPYSSSFMADFAVKHFNKSISTEKQTSTPSKLVTDDVSVDALCMLPSSEDLLCSDEVLLSAILAQEILDVSSATETSNFQDEGLLSTLDGVSESISDEIIMNSIGATQLQRTPNSFRSTTRQESVSTDQCNASLISALNSIKTTENNSLSLELKCELNHLHHQMEYIGQLASRIILDPEIQTSMQLAKPFVKKILDLPLSPSEDLSNYDHTFYANIKNNEMDCLELPWTINVVNHWNGKVEEIVLDEDLLITDENKEKYLERICKFKFETSICDEIKQFKQGFHKHIPPKVISLFNADEFSLLLNGVCSINVSDWQKNTKYSHGLTQNCVEVGWFWSLVRSLKEEEKTLLLKFATGSPCLPIGGFRNLMGLCGKTMFTIGRSNGKDKLPYASTCFNLISLPEYSSEKLLREKVLIAIRHGCEGFTFS